MEERNTGKPSRISTVPWARVLGSPLGVVVFLLVFRPFGLSLETTAHWLVVLGLFPVLVLSHCVLHFISWPRSFSQGVMKTLLPVIWITVTVLLYLLPFTAGPLSKRLLQVALVTVMFTLLVKVLLERLALKNEVIELQRSKTETTDSELVFAETSGNQILKLRPAELRFVKAEGNYVQVCWSAEGQQKTSLLRMTLAEAAAIAEAHLVQCHRSYLVNLGEADKISGSDRSMTVGFADGIAVPVSRGFAGQIRTYAMSREA